MVSLQAAIVAIALSGVGQTVLLDFYGDWCGPCRAMNPTVEALIAAGYPVQRVNSHKEPALAAKYRVENIPCFVMLVDGREVDRVVGGTSYARLERMCKLGAANASAAALAQSAPPAAQPTAPPAAPLSPAMASPFDAPPSPSAANPPAASPTNTVAGVSDATLIAASVRVRVEDSSGHSCGSGTIVDARNGDALILTCGHIFRDSKGHGKIEVDLFGPNGQQQRVLGGIMSYDSESRDVGVVAIHVPGPVVTAHVAPPGYRIERGMPVVSVGCNNAGLPSAQHSQVTSLDKFVGPPTIQVAGQPVEGRSGGGLFSRDGYLIGVCNAADPSDKEGLFAALGSIHAQLDQKNATGQEFSFVYKSSGESPTGSAEAPGAAAIAANAVPAMPKQMPDSAELAALGSATAAAAAAPSGLPPQEQAALEEIRRHLKDGSKVVCVICSRDPAAKSEVIMLDRASPEFLKQLADEVRSPDRERYPKTSLEVPRPRNKLLEWSAEK